MTIPELVRLGAASATGVFAAAAWARMLRPADPAPLLAAVAVGAALALLVAAARRLPRRRRRAVLGTAAALVPAAALLTAGVPLDLLAPGGWGELAAGLRQGAESLPAVAVPYAGSEDWVRTVLLLGGALPVVAAPALVVGGGRGRAAGLVALGVAYGVPAVQVPPTSPLLDGAAFALLLAALLWGDRIARQRALAAGVSVAAGLAVALVVAPRVDADRPWVDVRDVARSLADDRGIGFRWDHAYGPLDWPRDGRELLRVRARTAAYWKTASLSQFDGSVWRERSAGVDRRDTELALKRSWYQRLRVTVRGLRGDEFVGAATTLRIRRSPRDAVPASSGSFRVVGRPLRPGHSYHALVYSPRPSVEQLTGAGEDYPWFVRDELAVGLPGPEAGVVRFPAFGEQAALRGHYPRRAAHHLPGEPMLESSPYARTWRLAKRLRRGAPTPYAYVRRVLGHLERGFRYTETPPPAAVPLDAFLFRDRAGYCQYFSGAMAMLLRMGGVPARVAVGFSPGTRDERRGEYVVRDLDAHSWVEAYFPGQGWVTFDPTPEVAPPRLQAVGAGAERRETPAGRPRTGDASERAGDPAAATGPVEEEAAERRPWGLLGMIAAAGVAVVAARRRRRPSVDAVDELARALRRSGRPPGPGTTLRQVEAGLAGGPAQGYVQAVTAARYGYGSGVPTAAQRRALRRQLARGLGLRGRARAWWALPPWRP